MDLRTEIIDDVLVVELPKTGVKITGCEIIRRKVKFKVDTVMLVDFSGLKKAFQLPIGKWELLGSMAEFRELEAGPDIGNEWTTDRTFVFYSGELSY